MSRAVILTIGFIVGIGAATIGNQIVVAQQSPITRTILQQKDLEGAAGREVIMYRAEVEAGAVAGRHYHPGPELLYVLEGSLILEALGAPADDAQVGDTAHVPAKHIHNAKKRQLHGPHEGPRLSGRGERPAPGHARAVRSRAR